ncbi:ImuA family protein [Tepidamorphus sp. 3E244]|uniref:ImuA family protein n=1 Tax=Tepidamorphus sp. 3E244 TaxID=3385498 RepID=UPI0038FCD44F
MQDTLATLRRRMEAVQARPRARGAIAFGEEEMDRGLNGAFRRGALHECAVGEEAEGAVLSGFAAGLAHRISPGPGRIVWIRQTISELETGALYPPGLVALGLDPDRVLAVRTRRAEDALRAGLEAARCSALPVVFIETWRSPGPLTLTVSRRLGLAAERSGVTVIVLRVGGEMRPSAAFTRWQVRAAPSRALGANAPGLPAFELTLLRNRAGASGQRWCVEWDHDKRQFRTLPPLPGRVVPLPAEGPARMAGAPLQQTG